MQPNETQRKPEEHLHPRHSNLCISDYVVVEGNPSVLRSTARNFKSLDGAVTAVGIAIVSPTVGEYNGLNLE